MLYSILGVMRPDRWLNRTQVLVCVCGVRPDHRRTTQEGLDKCLIHQLLGPVLSPSWAADREGAAQEGADGMLDSSSNRGVACQVWKTRPSCTVWVCTAHTDWPLTHCTYREHILYDSLRCCMPVGACDRAQGCSCAQESSSF
jgi:hypothetical protein